MRFEDGWIAVDWGSTNRRAYAVDGDGRVVHRTSDALGVLSVAAGGFSQSVRAIRDEFGARPMLLAGMIGSNRGWIEAPYLPCPADLDGIAAALVKTGEPDTRIVPGVKIDSGERCDVMRGEEVQLLGAVAAGLAPADGTICHPGTHAKWARMAAGAIADFRTIMTGEVFALLKRHSILAALLDAPVIADDAFLAGVDRGLAGVSPISDLFAVRARALLRGLEPAEAAPYVSGLLIGGDVRAGLAEREPHDPVTVIGDPNLTALYAAAIDRAGRSAVAVDGERAFLAGIEGIVQKLI